MMAEKRVAKWVDLLGIEKALWMGSEMVLKLAAI
jgi:hypothetical protein